MKNRFNRPRIIGWIAVGLSTAISSFWAFWGIIENFHEGWYLSTLKGNIGLMLAQYLSPMLVFMALTVIAIYRPKVGALMHAVLAAFSCWFFRGGNPVTIFLITSMFLVMGFLYWFSDFQHKRIAVRIALGLPLLTLVIAGISPIVRVSQRIQEVDHSTQYITGNGVSLIWAPSGPGWPDSGEDWITADGICRRLDEGGTKIKERDMEIWRLPTVDEAVRSMSRHGVNCNGFWNEAAREARYEAKPDKEMPLWDIHSPVIYWWTATEVDDNTAFMIEYDGQVWPRKKLTTQTYFGFRCVRDMENK